ncbi:PUA domain-containing protein [[Eubacterium] cellulosolvens]
MNELFSKLADEYHFSFDAVEALYEVYNEDLERVLQSIKKPSDRFFSRVNTLKISTKELIDCFVSRGFDVYRFDPIDEAVFTPIEGPFEFSEVEKKIVVDKFAAESVLQGSHIYAPGIVKCSKLRKGNMVTIVDKYGQVVGVGRMRMSETEILNLRRGLAVEVTSPLYSAVSLRESEEYELGHVYPQSLPAIITSRVLDPLVGETVVDLNCSPGGKLSHISQLMQNQGRVIGVDRNVKKVDIARQTVERLGCKNVSLFPHDARYFDVDYPDLKADKVLVDPPCSALGHVPQLYSEISKKNILDLAAYQKQFLKSASQIIKDKGTIVYSVCTVTKQECEDVCIYAVDELGLEIEEQGLRLGLSGLKDSVDDASFLQRFDPHKHGIGYFIAKFKKKIDDC